MSDGEFASISVMAVEDEEFSQRITSKILYSIGVNDVLTANNGVEAIALLETTKSRIDLVICDIEMPEMDGYEFVRRIRYGTVPGYKEVPIVMLTGKDTEKNVRSARIHKINGFIVKPPQVDTVRRHLRDALGK